MFSPLLPLLNANAFFRCHPAERDLLLVLRTASSAGFSPEMMLHRIWWFRPEFAPVGPVLQRRRAISTQAFRLLTIEQARRTVNPLALNVSETHARFGCARKASSRSQQSA